MAERKIVSWFTMNGKHIPVFEGESKADAVKRATGGKSDEGGKGEPTSSDKKNKEIAKKNEEQKQKDIERNKKVADQLNTKKVKSKPTIEDIKKSLKDNKKVVVTGDDAVAILGESKQGIPMMIKMSKDLDWEQVIFLGKGEVQSRESYRFYDGSGFGGTFGVSPKFMKEHNDLKIKFNDNNPTALAKLMKELKGSK